MKKQVLLLILMLLPMLANAYDAYIDGIYYNFYGNAAEVTYGEIPYSGNVVIPASVTHNGVICSVISIGYSAFEGCTGLMSITIPESVTFIGEDAFKECTSLTSITIPNNVTRISNSTFEKCRSLTYFNIPNNVTSIGEEAFKDCSCMTSITIPGSVQNMGESAFEDCTNLTSVTLLDGVTTIGNSAFEKCSRLISVTFPNSLTSIGNSAFANCSGLTSITIPSSVKSIGKDAFEDCTGIMEVYCFAVNVPNTNDKAFKRVSTASATLYVPEVSVDVYRTTSPWSGFGTIVGLTQDMIDGINEIKNESLTPALSKGEGVWFTLDGKKLDKPQKGINIIRNPDGTSKKVLVK